MAAVNSWHSVYHLVMPPVLWLLGYSLGHSVNNKLDLFSKSRVFRVFSVCWTGAVISLSYIYFINALSLETDTDCYKLICSKSEEAEAGISYYQKIIRRNVLLRRLLGQQMEYYIQVTPSNTSIYVYELQREFCSSGFKSFLITVQGNFKESYFSGIRRVCPHDL